MRQKSSRKQSSIMMQKHIASPQVNIYNRNFYLRGSQIQLRRQQHEQQLKQLSNKPKMSVESYHINIQKLESKLMRAFLRYCQGIVREGDGQGEVCLDKSQVRYVELQDIVAEVCAVGDGGNEQERRNLQVFLGQLWLILGRYEISLEVNAKLLYTTLRIFLDPFNLNADQILQLLNNMQEFSKANQFRKKNQQYLPSQMKQQFLTVKQLIKLWKRIKISISTAIKPKKLQATQSKQTFKPQINKKSQYLAEQNLKKYLQSHQTALSRTLHTQAKNNQIQHQNQYQLSRYLTDSNQSSLNYRFFSKPCYYDILHHRKLQKDQIPRQQSREDSFMTSKVSRTARPSEIKQIVNNLYIVKKKNEDTDFTKRDQQNQLKFCTFSPKINQNYSSSRTSISPSMIRGYDKQVSRVQKGRQQKQRKKQAYQNLGKVKNFSRNYSKSPNKNIAPSFIDRDAPKLILQINIDGGRVEKLALKGNQNPHLVSKKFVIKHGLQQYMVQVLQALVKEQLENI